MRELYFMTGTVDKELLIYIEAEQGSKEVFMGFIKTMFARKEDEGTITIEQYNKELDEADAANR